MRRIALHRAAGHIRMLVVSCSTLAIMLVCYTIYEAATGGAYAPPKTNGGINPRDPISTDFTGPTTDMPQIGGIGTGERIRLTMYEPTGERPRMEIEVDRFSPIRSGSNEYLLENPKIRMRSKQGSDIEITAAQSIMEMRSRGGKLDPKRGNLTGGVTVLIDRRTDEDKAKLPEDQRNTLDPDHLVRIEVDKITFDAEYANITLVGPFRILAAEFEMHSRDMVIQFDETKNQIDQLQVRGAGSLELRQQSDRPGVTVPGLGTSIKSEITIASILRQAIEKQIAQASGQSPLSADQKTVIKPEAIDEEVPPFLPAGSTARAPKPPVTYLVEFAGDVEAEQRIQNAVVSTLQADRLQIRREFQDTDREQMAKSPAPADTPQDPALEPMSERIILTWTEHLVVNALDEAQLNSDPGPRDRITILGAPLTLQHFSQSGEDTAVSCERLVFYPQDGSAQLVSGANNPVIVRSGGQGTMTGAEFRYRRDGDRLHIHVDGPGTLVQNESGVRTVSDTVGGDENVTTITFNDSLDVTGRFITRRRLELTGLVSSKEVRVLEKAVFVGDVRMHQEGSDLRGDEIILHLGEGRGRNQGSASIERLDGTGHVFLGFDNNSVACGRISVLMAPDASGRPRPIKATAFKDINAVWDGRNIRAADKLDMDFAIVQTRPPPFDLDQARREALAGGLDLDRIDFDAVRREHNAKVETTSAIRRLVADGQVVVTDMPGRPNPFEVTADRLECDIVNGTEIESGLVIGSADRIARVRLGALTVFGETISVNVADQWADVPGPGRMSYASTKDLSGAVLDRPIPIVIEWNNWMKYRGRENQAIFNGAVRAFSEKETTFESEELVARFEDVPSPAADPAANPWWIFSGAVDRLKRPGPAASPLNISTFSKELTHLVATGGFTMITTEYDELTKALKSRMLLSGPKLTANLRTGSSKLLVEGGCSLLLEDYRPQAANAGTPPSEAGLFNLDANSGSSQTLIQCRDQMVYDFELDQTRFEGEVQLTHLAGTQMQLVPGSPAVPGNAASDRRTFLLCDVLTTDFSQPDGGGDKGGSRIGRISSDRLRQFQAKGNVTLEDGVEGLWISAETLTYEKDRDLLHVVGSPQQRARILSKRLGGGNTPVQTDEIFYNLKTGTLELKATYVRGG